MLDNYDAVNGAAETERMFITFNSGLGRVPELFLIGGTPGNLRSQPLV
jgi:hypothetical protein